MKRLSPREEELFAEALALPRADRAAFLAQACGDDTSLRARVAALIGAHESPEFDSPLVARAAVSVAAEERAGDWVDRYRLLQKIGEGGCGVVWMAEQENPGRHRVALKVIKLGMDTKAVIARFEAERQALGMMDHPNIAKVLDGGATATGRPYFVMELVRGIPITRFCDENSLPTQARLELFIQVCHAIQHAHQKGIIHRDIKPSNVLVTRHDDVAVPMVIDFGIAKATQGRLTDQTLFTAFEQFLGTPVYMSPEQAEFNALDVDTRSDVYSLGVLLYELLTGRPPFDPQGLREAGIEQIRRVIRETDPPRPSMRVRTLTDAERTTVARLRRTAPARLSTLLRGDLDWIVLKALEKNRTRRYQTANAFAVDIQRSMANEIVVARPPSAPYRLWKFVARHKAGFAASSAVAALLVGGLTWAMISFVREKAAREQAVTAQRLVAEQASRADVMLADRLLAEGKAAEGITHLVRAARTNAENGAVAPRLISALSLHNFPLPDGAPLALPSPAQAAASMADSHEVFTLGEDGVVRFIAADTWQLTREIRFEAKVSPRGWAVAANNAAVFAVYLADQTIVVCDTATGRRRFAPIRLPAPIEDNNPRMRMSADGRWLAVAQLSGAVWVWDARSGELRAALPNHTPQSGERIPYAFSPDGQLILTVPHGRGPQLWSLPDGAPVGEPIQETAQGGYRFAAFSADGRSLLVKYLNAAQFYETASGRRIGTPVPLAGDNVAAVDFSPDGRRFVVHHRRGAPAVWDAATRQVLYEELRQPGSIHEPGFSRDGRLLCTSAADGFARIWDLETGRLLAEPVWQQPRGMPAVLAPDGAHLIVFSAAGAAYRLRIPRNAAAPLVLPDNAEAFTAFLPGLPGRIMHIARQRATAFEVSSGRLAEGGITFPTAPSGELATAFSAAPDLQSVVVRIQQDKWAVWTPEGDRVREMPLPEVPPNPAFSFDAKGERLAVYRAGQPRGVSLWRLHSGRPELMMSFPDNLWLGAEGLARPKFSDEGRWLAFSTTDGLVRVCDANTGAETARLRVPGRFRVASFMFTPDGNRLLVTDSGGGVHFWETTTGRLVRSTLAHRDYACCCRGIASPDQREIVTHSFDGTVQVWDAMSGAPRGRALVVSDGPAWASFTRFGTIITHSREGIRLWDAENRLPVSEPMALGGEGLPDLSADGGYFACRARNLTRIWPVPPSHGPAPVWLLRLATALAGRRLTTEGELLAAEDEIAQFEEIRRAVTALPRDAPYAEWGRWLLADPVTRSIAPGFTMTPREAQAFAAKLTAGMDRAPASPAR